MSAAGKVTDLVKVRLLGGCLIKGNHPGFPSLTFVWTGDFPPLSKLKPNFDGSCIWDRRMEGFGGLIRNHLGDECLTFEGPLQGGSAIDAKLQALWRGV